jgi:uncharacterized protein (TIRG00374 family)
MSSSASRGPDAEARDLPLRRDPAREESPKAAPPEPERRARRGTLVLRILVSAILLGLLLHQVGLREILADVGRLPLLFVLFAWGYYSFCQLLSAWRWQLFLTAKGVHVPVTRLFSFYMVGMFLNNFMPGSVGGDVVKTYDLYRATGQGRIAIVSVFLERFTGLIGLALIAVAALVIGLRGLDNPVILGAVGGTALVLALSVAGLWWPPLADRLMRLVDRVLPRRIGEPLHGLYAALADYRRHGRVLLVTILLSVIVHLLFAGYYALTSQALGDPIPFEYFVLFMPLVTIVTMIPISLGGLGIREALMVALFAAVGVEAAHVMAISLTVHVINTVLSLWGGLILVTRKRPSTRPADADG